MQKDQSEQARREFHALGLSAIVILFGGVIEFFYMSASQSLALIADVIHMAGDFTINLLGAIFVWLANRVATERRTYGHGRYEQIGSLIISILLVVGMGHILKEAVERFGHPRIVQTTAMLHGALAGLVANIVAFFILKERHGGHEKKHHGVKWAVLLHVICDLGSSASIVAGAILGWSEPFLASVVVLVVFLAACLIFQEAVDVLVDSMPPGVTPTLIKQKLCLIKGVKDVHHIHGRTLGKGYSFTGHVVVQDQFVSQGARIIKEINAVLYELGFKHTTLQLECKDCPPEFQCFSPPEDPGGDP